MEIEYYTDLATVPLPHVYVFASNLAGSAGHANAQIARDRYGRRTTVLGLDKTYKGESYAIATRDAYLVRMVPWADIERSLEALKFLIAEDKEPRKWVISRLYIGLTPDQRRMMLDLVRKHITCPSIRDRVIVEALPPVQTSFRKPR